MKIIHLLDYKEKIKWSWLWLILSHQVSEKGQTNEITQVSLLCFKGYPFPLYCLSLSLDHNPLYFRTLTPL